jgi:alanine racemase
MAPRNEKIAVIPVGYSHGYSRSLSNLGHVLIRGRKAAIIGMVNMNMLIANVSSIPFVRKGDEVVLIGKQGHQLISVSSFADLANYVNYEMLTRLPADIPRFVT